MGRKQIIIAREQISHYMNVQLVSAVAECAIEQEMNRQYILAILKHVGTPSTAHSCHISFRLSNIRTHARTHSKLTHPHKRTHARTHVHAHKHTYTRIHDRKIAYEINVMVTVDLLDRFYRITGVVIQFNVYKVICFSLQLCALFI